MHISSILKHESYNRVKETIVFIPILKVVEFVASSLPKVNLWRSLLGNKFHCDHDSDSQECLYRMAALAAELKFELETVVQTIYIVHGASNPL